MWTAEQLRAINEDGNLLVSAAAGAGKTAVMTERIARIIASGTDVSGNTCCNVYEPRRC